jgi:basic membrane lipoprotein Med (substrate-binding protein (PBP1-ABC) superfamily)
MYINVYKIILLACMCCVGICWISCSGNSDDSEQTEVILSVDKNTLTADGKDIITFTVMHAGIDVTADAIIRSVMDGQTLDGNTFSTSKAGTYAFEASYGNYVSKLERMIASAVTSIPACITVKVIISFPSAVNVFLSTLKITSVCSESSELPEQEIQHIPTQHIQASNIIL